MKIFVSIFLLILSSPPLSAELNAQTKDSLILYHKGISNYQIVVPRKPTNSEMQAASSFQELFLYATGFELPVVRDKKKLKHPSILIGDTRFTRKWNRDLIPVDLEEDGFRIHSINPHLLITGGTDKGLLYGVFSFFEKYLGFRQYTSRVKLYPRHSEIIVPSISFTEIPHFRFRETYYSDILDNAQFSDWLKADTHQKEWGMWVHTFQRLIPSERYFSNHPEFFAENKGKRVPHTQLCLSNQAMLDTLIQNLRFEIYKRPEPHYWSVSQNDNTGFCTCPACSGFDAGHGSHSAAVLRFVNQVAKAFPDKTISTLAYQYSRPAPSDIVPAKNVNIMFCSIECNRSLPIPDDPSSDGFRQDLEDWSRLTSDILVWDYVIQFENLVSPFPNLRVLQPNIQYFADNGVTAMFQQGNRETGGEFAGLRSYMIAKLLWDPWQDVDSLMGDFLDGYYGPAGPYLMEYIDAMHDALERSGKDLWIFGGPADHRDGYLSWEQMDTYARIFDHAEFAVHDQPDYLDRVRQARLPLMYAWLENARTEAKNPRGLFNFSDGRWMVKPEMDTLLDNFIKLCEKEGITRLKEWNLTPAEYYYEYKKLMELGISVHLGYEHKVDLTWPFSPRYSGDAENALTDGVRGSVDFHHLWQGFEEVDMEAMVDLGQLREVQKVELRFLQDIRQWIFLPTHVTVYGSEDGHEYKEMGTIQTKISPREPGVFIESYETRVAPVMVRYIKVFAGNMGVCPEWHMGSGGKAWIFTDEIVIE